MTAPSAPSSEQPVGDRLLSNTGALLVARLAVAAMGWIGTVLISNTLSRTQFGEFSLVFSVLGMLNIVTELGIGRLAIAGVLDESRDRATFAGTYVLLRTTLGVIGYGVALAFIALANYPPSVLRTMAVAGLVVLLATPSHAYNVAFQATLRMPQVAVGEVFGQMAQLALTIALIVHGGTLAWFAAPAVLCEIVILSFKRPRAARLIPFRYVIDTTIWWSLVREAVPISVGTALATVYYRLDSVMLSKLDTFESVAAYGIAYKFVDLAHFVSTALSVPILTLLVRSWPDDLDRFRDGVRRGVSVLAVAATIVVAEIVVFAHQLMALLYRKYVAAASATKVLVIAECVGYFGTFAFSILLATGRHRRYPLITAAGLVLNIVLNLLLIPHFSYRAAAADTLITEIVVATLLWFVVWRLPGIHPLAIGRLIRLPVAFAAGAGSGLALRAILPWPVAAAVSTIVTIATIQLVHAAGPGNVLDALRARPSPPPSSTTPSTSP